MQLTLIIMLLCCISSNAFAEIVTVSGNTVLNVQHEVAYVSAKDQSTVNLLPEGNISHFNLYNQARTRITGGYISFLVMNDQSRAEIISEVDIGWLHVAGDSVVDIYGSDFSYSGGHLSGKWANGAEFSFWALPGKPGEPVIPGNTLPANIILHDSSYAIIDTDNDGVIDSWDKCSGTPEISCVSSDGCPCVCLKDVNGDGKIGIAEVIRILQITTGQP